MINLMPNQKQYNKLILLEIQMVIIIIIIFFSIFFIVEEVKEKNLDLPQGAVKVLWMCSTVSFCSKVISL